MEYKVVLFIVLIALALYFYDKNKHNKKSSKVFEGRESLTNQEFYNLYFKKNNTPEYIVIGVKEILEEQLGESLEKLSAEDDFSKNINFFFERDSMADVEIVICLENKFNIAIEDSEAVETHTVRDIVNLVWQKLK